MSNITLHRKRKPSALRIGEQLADGSTVTWIHECRNGVFVIGVKIREHHDVLIRLADEQIEVAK